MERLKNSPDSVKSFVIENAEDGRVVDDLALEESFEPWLLRELTANDNPDVWGVARSLADIEPFKSVVDYDLATYVTVFNRTLAKLRPFWDFQD